MAQHTRPEILRTIHATLTADMPTCHRCSWAWRDGGFVIKRPSGACEVGKHRRLLEGQVPAPLSNLFFQAS